MRLVFRIVFAVFAALIVVIVGLLLLPGDRIARLAADQIEAQTGRVLSFEGDVSFSLWPTLGVRTGLVTLSNADWAGSEPMLRAQGLAIGVAASDLLRGQVRVQTVVAQDPHLNLSTRADGLGNWVVSAPDAPEPDPGTASGTVSDVPLVVENISLRGASLTYAGHGQEVVRISGVDLDLSWPDPDAAAELALVWHRDGGPVDITSEFGDFGGFLAGQVAPVGATVRAAGGSARFDGRVSLTGEAAGRVTLAAEDGRSFAKALVPELSVPDALARALTLGSDVTYTADGQMALRDLALDLGGNRVTGAADIMIGAVPNVTARLQAGALDITALAPLGGVTGGGATSQSGSGWSRDPIEAGALALFDANVDLTVQSVQTSKVLIGASNVNLSVERARAVITLAPVSVFGGAVQGQLVANNRGGLSVGGNLTATGIETLDLLRDLGGYERLSGKGNAQVQFLGVGNSVDAIMRSLSGSGRLEVGRGRILGFDLEALMRSGAGNGGTTVFDSLTASYTIAGGNLDNQDLLMSLRNFRADGQGRIGLGAQDIDYLFTPVALRANAGQGLSIPVRIRGPWANPDILPDLSDVLENKLDVKVDELEDQAKDELRRKLEEELDAPVAEDQDVEELLKDRLEDEARKGLFKLLGVD
jgi:AsmA protein